MIDMLKKLPTSTQETLQFAACIGRKFDLRTLCVISGKSPQEAFRDLEEAIQQGFILPLSELDEQLLIQDYQFQHDRIQQAAYTLITDENKKALHLKIGRLLWQNTLPDQLSEQLFVIVDHFNLGLELVFHQYERTEIARLNLMAGKKAKAAAAYDSAIKYFNIGRNLLTENSWETECEVTLELYVESIEAAYFKGNYETVKTLYTIVFERVKTVIEKIYSIPKATKTTLSTSTEIASTLNLKSILKALQTLSGELSLETLLTKMMGIVLENAGAQKGYLILKQNGEWVIEASGTIACDEVQVLQSIPLAAVSGNSETPMVSNAIANYVIRTQTTLVLEDAAYEGEFTHDPYILKQQPKSILCTPLLNQGTLVGILYLENNLISGAFTPDRLEVLNLLSSQVAISIENAKLYAQLRESESKWTQILEAVPIGVSVYNINSKISYLNQNGKRILGQGLKPEATCDQLAQAYQLYIAGTDQLYPTEQLPALRVLRGETAILEDLEVHQDGIIIPLEVRTTPVFDEQGNIKYGVIAFQDITERRKAEKLLTDYNRTLEAEVTQRTAELTQINQQLEREIADRKRIQDSLQQSEARYRAIVEDQTELVSRILPDGTLTFINEAFCRYFKVKQEDLIGKRYAPVVFADDLEHVEQQVKSINRDNPVVIIENRVVVAGEVRWTQWINRGLFDQQGNLVELQAIGRDISDKKQVELALQESERRYRQIVETADEGMWVLDPQGNTIFANPKMAQILGYSVEEMLGMPVFAFMDEEWQATAKQNLAHRSQGIAGKHDFKLRRKDGCELWVMMASSPIFDESGQYTGVLGMMTDITQRKYAEDALRRYERIVSTTTDAIVLIDRNYCYQVANQTYQSWRKKRDEDVIGHSVSEILGAEVFENFVKQLLNRCLEGETIHYQAWFDYGPEERRFLSVTYVPYVEPDHTISGVVASFRDLTELKQAEEALEQSERLFRLLAEISPVGIFRSDMSGQSIYANERACQIVSATLEDVLRWGWGSFIHPEDAQRVQHTWQYAITHQTPWQDEYRLLNREGKTIWVLSQAEVERDEAGNVVGYVGTLTDISDRKAAEITLKQQKELLQAIFDHLPVMLCFYDTNTQVLLANRALENILGWSLEELRQIDILTECYPDPDYRASVFEFMMRADGTWLDLQTKTRDGRWLETSWANVRLPDGSHVGIGQDITERKRAEQALRDSEERFREIAETISQFFFVRSAASGQYLYANPAYERIWGRTCESLYQNPQSWLETIHPDDRLLVQNSIQKQYQGTPVKREYRIIRPDGQVRWIVADISVVCDETGQPQRFVGLAEDITERKQAEQALRESENRFRAVFEKAAVGIGLCTLEGRFFRVNQKLCSIVGYTDIEMLERTFEQITPVKDRPQMRDFTQQLLAGEIENYSLEHRYICKDGSIAWVNVAVSLMHEPTGEPNSFIYVAEDISDRKLAELALVKSEHALAEAQRLAHVGNWSFDLLTRELTWSEETFRIYGLDPTQGEPSEEEHLQQLHPDDREKVLRSIELSVTQGQPYEHEIRMFLPNGLMRYTLRRGQPVFNEMGQVVKLFGTVQDITERKQAEEELRESEEKFRQLAENIEEVFFILSQTGEILYISSAYEHIWGKTCQSLYHNSYSWLESVHPEEQEAMLAALNRQIRDTAEFDETYRIVRSDGEIRWIRARSFPIEHQNSHRFVGIAEDISDRKLAEDALQQAKEAAEAANQAKSAFLANMSHELRTPLNAILGFAQLLNRSSSLPPEHKKNITTIIRSGEHLLTLINQILDLSKIEAGRTTLNETSFDLYNFLEDVKDMFQLKANNKGLQLRFEYSSDLPQYVRTDEVKLRQILINLLSNAMKFTASGGVSLRVSRGISQAQENTNYPLHFEIEDTGSGIASDELESIFEAFVQTKTGQQYREGTGLGLTISRKFVQLMGGEISITSKVGKGTSISFDIQATGVEAAAIESKLPLRRVIALEPNQPLYRILIVDDRTDNRQVLIELLSPFGFELKEASNGLEAIEIWEVWQPHLIFMDMRMPGMDGFETIQRIKATTKGQATAIIALTASSLEEERTAIITAGCDDFIRKPFQEAEIFDALHNSIGVRFIYDEPTAAPIKTATRTELSIPAALATLPPDIVADFHKALLELDVGRVQTTIDQIRLLNEPLADAIATFANKFEYEQLLNFILQSNR